MITVRRSEERGRTELDWLHSRHTFSFGEYYDPAHMNFRHLRVINEDRVEPGRGFGTHAHRDMEIVTVVLAGALEHSDSLGNGSVIRPGEVQRMSAGTGIQHSEFNHSKSALVHFLQIWIVPSEEGLAPSYEQRLFPVDEEQRGRLRLIAAGGGREGSVTIHQDVDLYATTLDAGASVTHRIGRDRYAWVQVARGALGVNDVPLRAGDGAAISSEGQLTLRADEPADALLFDLA